MRKQAVSCSGQRYQYILTIQDVFSRYLWLRPLTYKTSKVVSKALGDLYIEVGPPKVLQSDRGGEFKKWVKKLCKNLNVKMIQSRPYHPQSQGKVERSHRALRKKITFDFGHLRKSGVNWAKQLKEYQKLQNEESMEALGNKSPFEVFYSRKSNAVLNHQPGGRCARECTFAKVQSPKSTDYAQNKKFDAIRSRAKKASNVWDKRNINRRIKSNPPSTYELNENVFIHYPFSRTSRTAPKRRFVITAQVLKRKLKKFRYKVSYRHPETGDKTTSWISVEDISETVEKENCKRQEARKELSSKYTSAKKQQLPCDRPKNARSKFYIPMTVEDVYEEFTSQGYNVVFNPDGNGDCQFSAIAHHLASIGIFRSERTIQEEISQYLEQNPSETDGFPLELFVGVPWSQYLASMALNGTYGDQLTLQAASNLYLIQLTTVSSLGVDAMVHIFPQHSPPVASFALGHFSEEDGIHYVSLAREQEESENNEDGNQFDMTENVEGEKGTDKNVEECEAENSSGNRGDNTEDKDVGEGVNEEQGQGGDDGRVEEVIRVEDDLNPFDLLPDELLEIIIAQSLSGLSRGSFVRAFTRLQNVCSRFLRIVLQHQHSLPRLHLDGNICPGYNSVMSLIRKYGKGSGVVIELKGIICSKKWTQAWVELVFTGLCWWFYIHALSGSHHTAVPIWFNC